MFRFAAAEADYKKTRKYLDAKREIRRFIDAVCISTIGAVGKRFPEYGEYTLSILSDLKDEGSINYDDNKPPPTKINSNKKPKNVC